MSKTAEAKIDVVSIDPATGEADLIMCFASGSIGALGADFRPHLVDKVNWYIHYARSGQLSAQFSEFNGSAVTIAFLHQDELEPEIANFVDGLGEALAKAGFKFKREQRA